MAPGGHEQVARRADTISKAQPKGHNVRDIDGVPL